jgi:superfamily II DNA or RNA helicase
VNGNVLKGLKYKTLLGLTATPYRGSELDQENLDSVFHKNMFYQKIREELKDKCSLTNDKQLFSKPIVKQIETNYKVSFSEELQFQGQIYKFNNPTRNQKIVDTYIQYRDKFKRAIIFAVDTHHANELAKLINQKYPNECQSFHNGDIKADALKKLVQI